MASGAFPPNFPQFLRPLIDVESATITTVTETRRCPANQFCYVYASYLVNDCKVKAYGHCCPHSCPMGDPHPRASCERNAKVNCKDQEGYSCRRSYMTPETVRAFGLKMDHLFMATCCPSHCPEGYVALNDGHCIPKAKVGESCWRDEQCPFTVSCVRG